MIHVGLTFWLGMSVIPMFFSTRQSNNVTLQCILGTRLSYDSNKCYVTRSFLHFMFFNWSISQSLLGSWNSSRSSDFTIYFPFYLTSSYCYLCLVSLSWYLHFADPDCLLEIVISTFQRLSNEAGPVELNLIWDCLYGEIIESVTNGHSMHVSRLLSVLVLIVENGFMKKISGAVQFALWFYLVLFYWDRKSVV